MDDKEFRRLVKINMNIVRMMLRRGVYREVNIPSFEMKRGLMVDFRDEGVTGDISIFSSFKRMAEGWERNEAVNVSEDRYN